MEITKTEKKSHVFAVAPHAGAWIEIVTGEESKNYPIPFATGRDKILIKKFHKLPVEIQQEVLAFIDFKIAQSIDKSSKQRIS